MAVLSEFIGEILDSISKGRSYSDYASANVSEKYNADPFIKSLPVPHYTIDEAEVDVPVIVIGIRTNKEQFQAKKDGILGSVNEKLPILLHRCLKYNYEQESEPYGNQKQNQEYKPRKSNAPSEVNLEEEQHEISQEDLNIIDNLSDSITEKSSKTMKKYLENYNYEILKLLDLTEEFKKKLIRIFEKNLKSIPRGKYPISNDDYIGKTVSFIGNIMFFEFKKLMQATGNIEVDVSTSQMNEFSSKNDCLMHIKLKIREQDLNLLIEEKDGKEKRYLSLT